MAKKQFKAESKRLLDLMINSIYTHKEIFLREILSNASDAIDKLAYLSLTDENVGLNRSDFEIKIIRDSKYRTLTISDNGIGMNKEEMEQNLGTICQSGSRLFKQDMEANEDVDIIGQFGVGFYSAFMVADHVSVVSRKYGEEQAYLWQSSGADGYTIIKCERDTPGTDVMLKLKEDTEDEKFGRFLAQYEIENLVKKYSDYIHYPIRMDMEIVKSVENPDNPKEPKYETVTECKTLNSMVPLWQKNKKDITQEEYDAFYKGNYGDFEAPFATIHTSVEGTVSYKALLFVPKKATPDFYTTEYKKGLRLYSSGVLILEHCEDLLPEHFRFVRGIVDSPDLSLNISRELLQHDRQLKRIATNIEKKIRAELTRLMSEDREGYEAFFGAFGRQLKIGVVTDYEKKNTALYDLLLYWSAKQEKLITLKEYTDSRVEGQDRIYFATGELRSRVAQQPQVEMLQNKGYDVLLMTEDVDEFSARTIGTYEDAFFCNALTDELGLSSDDERKEQEEKAKDLKHVTDFIAEKLSEKVKEVRISDALGTHPVSLASDSGMSFEMEKYFKRLNPEMKENFGRILEINPEHAAIQALSNAIEAEPEKAEKYALILYCQACIMADLVLDDPTMYTDLVCELMK